MRFWKAILAAGLVLTAIPVFAQESTPTATPIPMDGASSGEDSIRAQAAAGSVIELDSTVEGSLSSDQPTAEFTFEGTTDVMITITLISDDFDCYLVLLGPDGTQVARDDDSAGDLDSRIGPLTLPSAGTYTIVAQSYGYQSSGSTAASGDFTLSLNTFETRMIEYTQTVNGELTQNELTAAFSFRGQADDAVIIRMESSDFDSYLTLVGPDGYELAYNDDGAGNLNSLIGPFTLPQTGDYIINARSLGGTSTGEFTLSLNRAQIASIEYGETVSLDVTENDTVFYLSFEGNSGDVVSVSVDSNRSVDTTLRLSDPYNYLLISDEDSGSAFDPEIMNYILTSFGTHLIALEAPYGGEGTVEVTLTRGTLPSLDDGSLTLTFSNNRTDSSVSFTGEAGETVTLNIATRSGTASPSVDVTQNGSSLTYFSSSNIRGMSVSFDVPSDGEVVLRFSEYSYRNVSLQVSFERE